MVKGPMSGTSSTNMNPSVVGMSKVFMLDKYFTELQKFWDTEKRLQGKLPLLWPGALFYITRVVGYVDKGVSNIPYLPHWGVLEQGGNSPL